MSDDQQTQSHAIERSQWVTHVVTHSVSDVSRGQSDSGPNREAVPHGRVLLLLLRQGEAKWAGTSAPHARSNVVPDEISHVQCRKSYAISQQHTDVGSYVRTRQSNSIPKLLAIETPHSCSHGESNLYGG